LTTFLLRILFTGLMVFIPSEDGTEVTVLLLNADHAYHTSDGSELHKHNPVLIARSGGCTGTCPKDDAAIAKYLFADKTQAAAIDALEAAVAGGGAWQLTGSDLSLLKGSTNDPALPALTLQTGVRGTSNGVPLMVPTTSAEREDYTWLASIRQLCPTCTVNPAVLGSQPPTGLVAARFRLRSGKVFTYSVARIGANVTPVKFTRLDGTGSPSSYSQAIASWIGADIQVEGDSIEIVDAKFAGGPGRSMTLTPDSTGKVEIAMLNLPPFVPPATQDNEAPEVGKHFEMYYDVSSTAPSQAARLVPRAGAVASASYPQVDWHLVHPTTTLYSELLNKLRLDIGRSAYDRVLCPPAGNNVP
jgi:hypothetical protein